ncbi:MAG: hypothetical protein ACXAB7_02620 [Candidatus Kariarchaeaceae archaeon]
MDKQTFINEFTETRTALSATILQLQAQNKMEARVDSTWRVKDVVAHINWYDEQTVIMLSTKAMEGSDYWNVPTHERNDIIFEDFKDTSTHAIIEQYERQSTKLAHGLTELNETDFHAPNSFRSMPSDLTPWEILTSNLQRHYADHLKQLRGII